MSELWYAKVEEGAGQDEATCHCPELPGHVGLWNEGDQGDKGDEGEGLNGAEETLEHGLGVGREEGVSQLASQTLQSKLDGEDVDGEDCNTYSLVSLWREELMKGSEGKEASKESKADSCGEEAQTEEKTNAEPLRVAKCHVARKLAV